ncbi:MULTISPECIES: hypothetical protein [Pseudomonas]|uniref:hypothetical protein n=1 Tax=Pseudomonas TaxID=286 RepID=UPI00130018FE|nr:hypothetical protein [Pseudomonas sichuanensis]
MKMRNKVLAVSLALIATVSVVMIGHHIKAKKQHAAAVRPELALSDVSPWQVGNYHQRSAVRLKPAAVDGYGIFPFTSLGGENRVGDLYIDATYHSKLIGPGVEIAFPFQGVPVDVKMIDGNYHVAFRKIFNGHLFSLTYARDGRLLGQQEIVLDGVDYPIFRASASGAGKLYWVVYDNKQRKNYLMDVARAGEPDGLRVELPSFYPPAGSTYEMEPPVFFSGDAQHGFDLIAGALYAKIRDGKVEGQRLNDCETVIEALFTPTGPAVLCRARIGMSSPYLSGMLNTQVLDPVDMSAGVPWRLEYRQAEGKVAVSRANTASEIAQVFLQDLRNGQQSGVLEFGVDNTEGRIPWSQIYYLNGLMDLLLLTDTHEQAKAIFGDVAGDLLRRVVIEVTALDDLLDRPDGFKTKGFTHDRSAALFAVQTSRLLLLFDRYAEELPNAPRLRNAEKLRHMVSNLEGHIDQLAHEGEEPQWMKPGTAHLRWPKCSAFYFDGLPVPFNHQNEWAYGLFNSARVKGQPVDSPELRDQRDIITFFMERLGVDGGFPPVDKWNYWYGHAYDGWTEADNRSCHTPSYPGDHGLAWISFRSIDFMSVMSAIDFIPGLNKEKLVNSAVETVKFGDVFPFAARSLLAVGKAPQIQIPVLQRYYRATAPWEISNSPWALVMGASSHAKQVNR